MAVVDQVDDDREAAFSHVREIELSRQEAIQEADGVLAEIVRAGRRATLGELSYFAQSLRWDERTVRQEIRRMMNVVRDRAIAGSAHDRAAAQAEAETAAGILQREGVKVAAKIAELTGKLAAMERDAKLSSQRVADQAEAVLRLRQNAPQHVRDQVQDRECELSRTIGQRLADCEIRINELDCNLDPSKYRNKESWLQALERSRRDAVEQVLTGQFISRKPSSQWPAIQAEMEAEREGLAGEIAKLKATIAAREAEIRKALDHYAAGD